MKQGPNVRRLIANRVAVLAIPNGSPNSGLADGIALFTTPGKLVELTKQATLDIEASIAAVKTANTNPYGDDDETIAGAILKAIGEKSGRKSVS